MAAEVAAVGSALVLAVVAGVHVYWAAGGRWPGHDDESLARAVVGGPEGTRMPPPAACLAVTAALLAAAASVLGAAGLLGDALTATPVRLVAWACAAVFGLRGLYGFLDARIRPATRGSRFARLNVVVYSPLCLGLAAGIVVALAM